MESQFFEPSRETKIGSKNRRVREIGGKISVFDWGEKRSPHLPLLKLPTPPPIFMNLFFFMAASSVSRQDELNYAMWSVTRAAKIVPSCSPGLPAKFYKKIVFFFHIENPLLAKLVWSLDGWILALFFFHMFIDLDFVSVHKCTHKKGLGQYPANNPYWPVCCPQQSSQFPHAHGTRVSTLSNVIKGILLHA